MADIGSLTYSVAFDELDDTSDELRDSTKEDQDPDENVWRRNAANLDTKYRDEENTCVTSKPV